MDKSEHDASAASIRDAVDRFEAEIANRPGSVWVACSGGLDSSVLAWAAAQSRLAGRRLGLVHVDHGVHARSREAAECVRALARQLGLQSRTFTVAPGHGRETDLRTARYALFRRLAAEEQTRDSGAARGENTTLLLGHHLDDQCETVLFRLRRGAGTRGLAGIPRRRPLTRDSEVARPLLAVRRRDLERVAASEGLQFVEDPTNLDLGPARNRLRHADLPALRSRHRDFDRRLLRLSERARERNNRLESEAESWCRPRRQTEPGRTHLELHGAETLTESVLTEALRLVSFERLGEAVSTDFLRRLHWLATSGRRGQRVEAHPRLSVRHLGAALAFERRDSPHSGDSSPARPY